jgi:major vault protein
MKLSAAVDRTGQAKAEAQSRVEAQKIQGEAAVEQTKLKLQAHKIEADAELEMQEMMSLNTQNNKLSLI